MRLISHILLLIVAANAGAQQSSAAPDSPEATARSFYEGMIRKDWNAVVQFVDPAELARNKAMFKPLFDRDSTRFLMQRLLNDKSGRRFDELSDNEFNSRLFAFFVGVSTQGSAIDRIQGVDILAVAKPEPDHAFVVYQWRLPAGERPIRGRNVTELHRRNGRWLMDMMADFTGIKEAYERQ